jgi:mRNA-degrading endonuclease RelE of RelBE toxin-antitoxin system
MATVVWVNRAQEEKRKLYLEGQLKFGFYAAIKMALKIAKIQKSLEDFPELGYREPLLEKASRIYRTRVVNKRYKLIYRYDEENDTVVIEDIWDTKRSPKNLTNRLNIEN